MIPCCGRFSSFFPDLGPFVTNGGHFHGGEAASAAFFWKLVGSVLWLCMENSRDSEGREAGLYATVSDQCFLSWGIGPKDEFESWMVGRLP